MSEGFPEGWSELKLGKVVSAIMGQSPPSSTYNTEGIGLPFFQGKADFGNHHPIVQMWCSEPTKVAPPNSVLFSVRAPVGDVNVTQQECCIGRGLSAITGTGINQSFLYQYLLFAKPRFQSLAQGSTFEAVNGTELREFEVSIPPIPEQQKIAAILTSVDDVIEKTEAQIYKLQDLKKGMMQELLTKGIGHTEFKNSPVGRIPKDWSVAELSSLFHFKNGVNKGGEYFGHGVPIISYRNVYSGGGILLSDILERVNLKPSEIERFNVLYGDVFFTRTSETADEIGLSNVYLGKPNNVVYNGFVIRARPKTHRLSVLFCKYCFLSNSVRQQMLFGCKYTTRAGISSEALAKIRIIVPPLTEQDKIAQAIGSIGRQLSTITKKVAGYKSLKKALMQDLLTGKVRVKVD